MYIVKIDQAAIQLGEIKDIPNDIFWNKTEFIKQISNRISAYSKSNIKKNETIILLNGNTAYFFADLIALWCIGCNVIPLPQDLTNDEIIKYYNISGAKIIILEINSYQLTLPFLETLKQSLDNSNDIQNIKLSSNAGLTLFTSGTTGTPRAVYFPIKKVITKVELIANQIGLEALERTFCFLPTSFGHGLVANSLTALMTGNQLIITKPLNIDGVLDIGKNLEEHRVTFLSSVPSAWRLICKYTTSPKVTTIKKICCASSPLDNTLWLAIKNWSQCEYVCNVYGITECLSWIAGDMKQSSFLDGKIGKVWTGEVKILKEDNSFGKPGEEGEVLIKNDFVLQEYAYYTREESEKYFHNGYFKTNDVGMLTDENELYLIGRKGSRINKAGVKIYPEEIDLIILDSGLVQESCSFGVKHEIAGEVLATAIVIKNNLNLNNLEIVDKIKEYLKIKLQKTKMPSRYYLVESIPKNERGKLDRKNMYEIAMNLNYFT